MAGATINEFAFFALAILIPSLLILGKRETGLVFWICICSSVDIFNVNFGVNVPSGALVGLLLLPVTLPWVGPVFRNAAGRLLLFQLLYLLVLAVLFGVIFPWPEAGLVRSFNETAGGRGLMELIHNIGDLSVLLYISDYVRNAGRLRKLLRLLTCCLTVASAIGLLSFLLRYNFYTFLTGTVDNLTGLHRFQGLSYEPRGLGLIATYGIILSLAQIAMKRTTLLMICLAANCAGLFVTLSLSGAAALGGGLIALLLLEQRARGPILMASAIGIAMAFLLFRFDPAAANYWATHEQDHEVAEVEALQTPDLVERVAVRAGFADAGPILYLHAHPWSILSGVGPGMIVLPGTMELAHFPIYQYMWEGKTQGVIVPPMVGLLRQITDGGLLALGLLTAFVFLSAREMGRMAAEDPIWQVGRIAFVAAFCIYMVQVATFSPISSVLMGTGLAAVRQMQLREAYEPAEARGLERTEAALA